MMNGAMMNGNMMSGGMMWAMGAAQIILSLAPCALMCAVDICCSKKKG